MRLRLPLLLLALLLCLQAYATHIVGGEFELQHLSKNEYRLSLNVYFDEIYGRQNQKDGAVFVTIFEKGTDQAVRHLTLPLKETSLLNYTNVAVRVAI
ncbi:hypothetical protein CLV24_1265 [Pontibacter ummariensis]|uniref:Uncharacterized protein n=1 Tax=Pontibacter ummariensis TaxID=1610492 RepID=A0A239K7E6_9BACT|nr:hypothetical protein [Pontibacter ummariensis]PRY06739.1 hypothetical protein CLV24_1265 [Pontibacter ummariensis]SNT13539.1 hypothetical protein SAMN06296052_12648 [Pontibacter ummariensis]